MSRFRAIIAQLETQEKWIKEAETKAVVWHRHMRDELRDIADNAEAKGGAWASERARRALAETEEWYI